MRTVWRFHTANQLIFGRNAIAELGEAAVRLGIKRAFLVTDPILLRAGVVETVHAPLSVSGVAVGICSGGETEPSLPAAAHAPGPARALRPAAAGGGMGGVTHAIEAYTGVDHEVFPLPHGERSVYQGRHPLGDVVAEKAIALIGANLRRAVANGQDEEAREGMALAATLAGMAFSNVGVAAVHALEYPVGGATHCSHGAGNGLLLPYVMRFNLPARLARFATIARLLGEKVSGLDEAQAAESAIT